MASDFELTSSSTYTSTYGTDSTATNPDGELDSDAFMTLLLAQLQYQDPTDPMDSETILSQTSQLASLESATNTNTALDDLTSQLSSSTDLGALNAIGKMASLGTSAITYESGQTSEFDMYFDDEISDGTISITDSSGNTIKTASLSSQAGKSGTLGFSWDGTDSDGNSVESGEYNIKATYITPDDTIKTTQVGVYPVESVKYDNGVASVKVGNSYVAFDDISEFY